MVVKQKISILAISMNSGGAEKVISLLLPKLVNDYEVHLILFQEGYHFEIPQSVTIKILNQKSQTSRIDKVLYFPKLIWEYIRYVKSENIAIAISFLTRPNIINGILKMWLPKVKTVISERCYPSVAYSSYKWRDRLYKILLPIFYNKANIVFSNSLHINEDLSSNYGVNRPMKVIYNPIVIKERIVLPDNATFTIANIGSLTKVKQQELLLQAIHKCSNSQAIIMGEGPLKEALTDFVINTQIQEKVLFAGKVSNVFEYLSKCDCFVLTSITEGFPNAMVEAMSVGLPIISTNCKSGPLEILNDNEPINIPQESYAIAKYGILINVGDHHGLIAAINILKNDKALRIQLSEQAYNRSKEYDLDSIYISFKSMIEN